jgi:CBS domain-containing protein
MQVKGVRRAPVVDGQGGLIGIVTGDDLIEMISEQLGSFVSLVNKGEEREHTLRT